MGLVGRLVTLPLAPIQGVMALAERLADIAEEELHGEPAIRRQLEELGRDRRAGRLTDDDYAQAEATLLARLMDRPAHSEMRLRR